MSERAELGAALAADAFTDVGSWMKSVHGGEEPSVPETDLLVRETDDPAGEAYVRANWRSPG